ncbi:hypothetical protein H1R20_g3932, partial [Candolleomyces eurysporus]
MPPKLNAPEYSTSVGSVPDQDVGPFTPRNPSSPLLPQDSMPQSSKHPSANEINRAESLCSSGPVAYISTPVIKKTPLKVINLPCYQRQQRDDDIARSSGPSAIFPFSGDTLPG